MIVLILSDPTYVNHIQTACAVMLTPTEEDMNMLSGAWIDAALELRLI